MTQPREATVTFTMFQNVSVNLDTFEAVYGLKPTKANIIEVATGMRGHTDNAAFGECVSSGGEIIIETEITEWPGPKVKAEIPKVKKGRGSY